MTLRYGELFAGYGGLYLGLNTVLPGEVTWYADPAPGPAAVMARHYPHAPNLGDVTRVDWSQVEPVDVLTGGSPCPDISSAGKRAGMRPGTRSGLWAAMVDAIDALRPPLVVWENVRGATSAAAHSSVEPCQGCLGDRPGEPVLRALGRVLGDLANLGYDAFWTGLHAAQVGAPHGRYRLFLFATPGQDRPPVRHPGHPETPSEIRGPGLELALLPTPVHNDMGGNKTLDWWAEWTTAQAERHGNSNGHGRSLGIESRRLLPGHWLEYQEAITRWEAILGRAAPHALQVDRGPLPLVLSPRFVEWMMGLDAGWVTDTPGIPRMAMLTLLGNGVVPQQVAAAAHLWAAQQEVAA